MKVAVIAGTPVDTRMGVDYINQKNEGVGSHFCEPIYLPAAEDCDEQIRFQYAAYEEKHKRINEIFDAAIRDGVRDFFIYCNSLSGAFDFDAYAEEKSGETGEAVRVFTPLQVYKAIGPRYRCVAVMAANNLSAHAIEEALMTDNPGLYVVGTGNMAIVRAIEQGEAPEEAAKRLHLAEMASYMEACGAEALILGCTHFPYLKDALEELTSLPLIDPADLMYEAMMS